MEMSISYIHACMHTPTVITVMFGAPSYTFMENGIYLRVDIVKVGLADRDISVFTSGG